MFGWFCPRRCDSTGGKVFTGFILNDAPESEEAGDFKARSAPSCVKWNRLNINALHTRKRSLHNSYYPILPNNILPSPPPPTGRICGKSSLHCFLHADAARISVKMADFLDASATGSICIALLPQMRQTVKCSRKRLQAATKLFMKSVAFTLSILYLCKCSFNTC